MTPITLPYDIDDPALARATWSRLAEPNSVTAAMVVGRLGPSPALRWLLEEAVDSSGQVRSSPRPPVPQLPPGMPSDGDIRACWAQVAARWAPRLEGLDIRRELDVLDRLGGSLILPGESWWPPGLDELEHPPFCLWVRGDPSLLVNAAELKDKGLGGGEAGSAGDDAQSVAGTGQPVREQRMPVGPASGLCLALVGARASTRYGEGVATSLASGVTAQGGLIVSGGAFGIDACAHRGALREGPTVSVSAGGVDRLYPVGNAGVLEAVIASGALVAEVPPDCQPGRHRFVSRNRVIAAISRATIVVEAAWRSGALSTAHRALELGRQLGAVPGPVTSMSSVGCHRLLRKGAVCITDTDDALELLTPLGTVDADAAKEQDPELSGGGLLDGLDPAASLVLDAMPARAAASTESIVRSSGLSPKETTSALGILELSGKVERTASGWRRRHPNRSGGRD
ncbi:DNA processing protein DprA [Actinomyces oris]|uniref:DNA processing protein DprA n=1 Tax=Actinomyces oris TaxID=544580 RepID=A0A1Q8VLP4_9ACTO|nr:DNA-processing protein DprA [Actinomyces oris]OLO49022.1 DNA processing protein DprA [Actinomyces oris]